MKEKYKTILMSILIIAMFGISLVVANNNQIVSTSANASGSKTIGWGIKRANNNMQPDVGPENKKMLDENGGICLGKDSE